jgi:hypothetical protein
MDFLNYLKVIFESINLKFIYYYNNKHNFKWKNHRLESVVIHKLQLRESNV